MTTTPLPIHRLALLIIAASLLLFVWMVRDVVVPVLVSALFAILLHPLLTKLETRLGRRASLAPLLVTAGSILLVFLPLTFVVFMAIGSVRDFFSSGFDQKILQAVPGRRGGSSGRRQRCLITGIPLICGAETPFMLPIVSEPAGSGSGTSGCREVRLGAS
jgi:hypothetical protein